MTRRLAAAGPTTSRALGETREAVARLEERFGALMSRLIEQLGTIEARLEHVSGVLEDHQRRLQAIEQGRAGRAQAWRDFLTYAMLLGTLILSGLRAFR